MPTLPSGGEPERDEPPVHRQRATAESFGVDAARYDRARPSYPRALAERIVSLLAPSRDVLDVGCGTGISSRLFRAEGCTVLGVDPDARMAELARRRYQLAVEKGVFEEWDPCGRTFDAVVSGQAWHWVAPDAGAARAARVLRPGGVLAPFWNAADPAPALGEAFAEVYARLLPDSPAAAWGDRPAVEAYEIMCAMAADGMREAGGFGAPEVRRFGWQHTYTRAAWLDQTATTGVHTRLPGPLLDRVLAGLGEAVDAAGGTVPVTYTTLAVVAVRE
ncbi:class I SAM-dependent methyltransferase [Streptomyces sp. NPDC087440]|uniref:class I SAM-dependent methyltransferase n=1 Tax=Streptomyces sp. NPDC087440 TaxID=3365790 RepID=UPI003821D3D5